MNYTECIEQARGRIGSHCKACWECNGRACKNQMPGPGSKGIGDTAIRNYDKWKEIRVQMDTLVENRPCDTTLELFGRTFQYPFFAGPVGAVQLHYGDCLNDISYNDIRFRLCGIWHRCFYRRRNRQQCHGRSDKSNQKCRRTGNSDRKAVEHRSDPGENGNGKRFRCLCRGNGY